MSADVYVRKDLPLSSAKLKEIADLYGTPIYVYDAAGIRGNAKRLNHAFAWAKGYKNYFAVKATPTPAILRLLAAEHFGFDCSSLAELVMVKQQGLQKAGIFYTSNNTPDSDYAYARSVGATINLDKGPYVDQVLRVFGDRPPTAMAVRFNPGEIVHGNAIIGHPSKAKFGAKAEDVIEALQRLRDWGVRRVGIHAMVVSNERDPARFGDTASVLRSLAHRFEKETGRGVDFINVGGGLGVNYHPSEQPVNVEAVSEAMRECLSDLDIDIVSEHGRFVTGPHGYLLTKVTHGIQYAHEPFLQVDTSINNMARLATVTKAYHQLDIVGKEHDTRIPMNVTGSMCANSDIMFKMESSDRVPGCSLPETVAAGDLMVIHDAGAHCRSNSHNYNFRLRCGEVLVERDGSHKMIRRHETVEDVFRTTKGLWRLRLPRSSRWRTHRG